MILEWLAEAGRPWIPTLAVAASATVILAALRRLLGRGRILRGSMSSLGQLVMLMITASFVVALIIVLPIGESMRGQLLTLFGLLATAAVALASTTFLGNLMAGLMLRAIQSFRPGDFVRIGEHFGRVSEKGLLHTEVQTEDGDLTTLPNLLFATNAVTVVRASATIVSATVSLGYDVHHSAAEVALRLAVSEAGLTDPFVLVSELGNNAVTYRAAGTLKDVKTLVSTRSRLRVSMLDALHGAGIEIVSPVFMNQRPLEPSATVAPPAHRSTRITSDLPDERMFDKAEAAAELAAVEGADDDVGR